MEQYLRTLSKFVKNKWAERILAFVIIPLLILLAVWLPPISLGNRLFHLDYPLVTPDQGGTLIVPNGASLTVPAQAVAKRTRMRMETVTRFDLAKAKSDRPEAIALQKIPKGVIPSDIFYRFEILGQPPAKAALRVPVPRGLAATETLDLYGWDGKEWRWLPSRVVVEGGKDVRANLAGVPSLVMVAQAQATPPRIVLGASAGARVASSDLGNATVCLSGPGLDAQGNVSKLPAPEQVAALKQSPVMLSVSNLIDGVVRTDLVDNLMADETARRAHVVKIVDAVKDCGVAGVEIVYQNIDPDLRTEFSAFIAELAKALHDSGKVLAVRVDAPTRQSQTWNTGAYDWMALGQAADIVRIPALADTAAYAPGGEMDQLIAWAVGEVDRRKIEFSIPAYSHDIEKDKQGRLSYSKALSLLAQNISADDADCMLLPGESVTLNVPDLNQAKIKFDQNAQIHWFTYQDSNRKDHTILLENASSVARKLQYVSRYALGGMIIEGALDEQNDRNIPQVVQNFKDNLVPPAPRFALVWTIEDAMGKTLDTRSVSLDDPKLSWTAPNNPGNYIIRAGISDDGGKSNLAPASKLDIQVPTPTFTPTPTPTNTPTATPTPTATNTPTATPKPTVQQAAAPQPAAAAPAPVARAATAGFFGYGIQADLVSDGNHQRIFDHIKGMGFNWVKQQIEWFRFNPAPGQYDWGAMDRIVDGANANGINVMFSVVKAPKWARPPGDTDEGPPADPATYAEFMRQMAARYKGRVKAYEIWNEQNLYYEWGGLGHKLNAARYVQLLAAAYNAIKSVDPGAIVISGAPTPTGVNDGDIAIDDRLYLEQMYQAGLARYCDAIGAHPSGYNNPPDADWTSFADPSASFGAKGHPSWFFRGTMESYRNIMIKYGDGGKRIWPTEFGWACVEGLGVPPARDYEYARDNTEAEQAQFIVRAYQMGRNWGFVGVMFLWNLNFGPVAGAHDEKAAFGIVRPDWSPRPAYAALRDMPK